MHIKHILTLLILLSVTSVKSQLVTTVAELNSAISSAAPGTTIILADGTWSDVLIDIDKNGTSDEPITITAQNAGAVLMTGNSRVVMEGSYLTVSGLVFQDPSNLDVSGSRIKPVIELDECDYCKIINNKIDNYNGTESQKELVFKWILTDGQYNEIAYNSFVGKYGVGSIINDNRNSTEPDYLKIHHNYFADRTPINGVNDDNDQDAIRIGNSSTSMSNSFSEIYDNYFYNFFGEIEIISNKSGQNKYYRNTFRNYSGSLTLRHGNDCDVYSNYFFAEKNLFSAGVRVIGEGHKIYNNYIEGINSKKADGSTSNVTGGINVTNGRPNSALNGYYQVRNTQIVNNTFVDCDYGLRIGTRVNSDLTLEPFNLTVSNNIMYNTSVNAYQIITTPSGTSLSEGNIVDLADGSLVDDGKFHRLMPGSGPIEAALGNYSFLEQDILGGSRSSNFDAGAEEFGANGTQFPYNETDVGVRLGFGAISEPTLSTIPITLIFDENGGTMQLEIVSNVDWTITENIPWLNLEFMSGTGSSIIDATAIKNSTGIEREGSIQIDEVGGSGLFAEVSVVQLNTFLPNEIQIIGATSKGMEDKEGISESNAYNDDLSNYWTGDPDVEPEVSITFDLKCVHELTEIGIHFWKAEERTTTFSIGTADDNEGPFTIVLDEITSAESGATVETEQLFSLAGIKARYVKFIGIGNSSSSNWTSIANVNIYGNINCEETLSVNGASENPDVAIYPNPITTGELTIISQFDVLGILDIYDITGRKVLSTDGLGNNKIKIDVSDFSSGTYFVRLENIGISKFIKK